MHGLRPWLRPALNLPRDRTVPSKASGRMDTAPSRSSIPHAPTLQQSSCSACRPWARQHHHHHQHHHISPKGSLPGSPCRGIGRPPPTSPPPPVGGCTHLRAAHSSMGETPPSHLIAVLPEDEKSAARGVNSALLCPVNSALGHIPLPRTAPPSPEAADAGRLDGRSPPSSATVSSILSPSILSPSILSACELEAEPLTACGPAASA